MKSRIIAFLASQNREETECNINAQKHLEAISKEFELKLYQEKIGNFQVSLCFEGDIKALVCNSDHQTSFFVGPTVSHYCPSHEANNRREAIRDRFLHVNIKGNTISIVNDYAGTIPVYYSTRDHLSLSNIEPITVLDSNTTTKDLSALNMYGYLRYSHYIWDETLYSHIFTQEPDTQYIYTCGKREIVKKYLRTIVASEKRINYDDSSVAKELFELNQKLIKESFNGNEEIILPLSAGYDSRMIFSAICNVPELKARLKCFTYGPEGSIEVESARDLCESEDVYWENINLPCSFLNRQYLYRIGLIFGSSLHFHGMYQLEFLDLIKSKIDVNNAVLTSGFMTGVPAGQHISKLAINHEETLLTEAMNNFAQSTYFLDDEILKLSPEFQKDFLFEAEKKFRIAFDRFNGNIDQKSVVFDIWTRQRNFISYHPRTLEWGIPCISPHMTPEYANFFLSLSKRHLTDRLAVELMFKNHYPQHSGILSNSNGIKTISDSFGALKFQLYRPLRVLGLKKVVPKRYQGIPINFNIPAIREGKKSGFWPLFDLPNSKVESLHRFFPDTLIAKWYYEAIQGSITSYEKLVFIQAVAYGIYNIRNTD